MPRLSDQTIIDRAMAILEKRMSYYAKGSALCSPADTRNYLRLKLEEKTAECFCVLFLDNQHRVIAFEQMFNGTINASSVYPREIMRRVIHHNAAAVILAHNHPSGVSEPSRADISITDRITTALNMIDVRTLDHLIVGHGEITSLAERGLITSN